MEAAGIGLHPGESVRYVITANKDKVKDWVLKLKPIANALTGETLGDTSQYQVVTPKLKGMTQFQGEIIRIKAKGTDFKHVWFLYPEGNEGVKKPDWAH